MRLILAHLWQLVLVPGEQVGEDVLRGPACGGAPRGVKIHLKQQEARIAGGSHLPLAMAPRGFYIEIYIIAASKRRYCMSSTRRRALAISMAIA